MPKGEVATQTMDGGLPTLRESVDIRQQEGHHPQCMDPGLWADLPRGELSWVASMMEWQAADHWNRVHSRISIQYTCPVCNVDLVTYHRAIDNITKYP